MSVRRRSSLMANPVLVGALTVLLVVVGVLLAYNANQGLPFVPVTRVEVDVPSAQSLIVGAEVRVAGTRVGRVTQIAPRHGGDGRLDARLTLEVDRSATPVRADTRVAIRPSSALGLEFVELRPGRRGRPLPDGGVLPATAARREAVTLGRAFDLFDAPTREAIRVNLTEIGNAVAGRGAALNDAVAGLPTLLATTEQVSRSLGRPRARLYRWIPAAGRLAAALAGPEDDLEPLVRDSGALLRTLGEQAPALSAAVADAPAMLVAVQRALPATRRLLGTARRVARSLAPGAVALRDAGGALRRLAQAGADDVHRARRLTPRLERLMRSLARAGADRAATAGLTGLGAAIAASGPALRALSQAERACGVASGATANLASTLSDGDGVGRWLRFVVVLPPDGPDSLGGPAARPAAGPEAVNHLRSTPLPRIRSGHCEGVAP